MGYVPPAVHIPWPDIPPSEDGYGRHTRPPRLNLDRHGMPRDYATYVWLLYGRRVEDKSPQRRAFLGSGRQHGGWGASMTI